MSSSHDLASRVQALEDIEAIKRLKARWWFACDTRDLAGMRACYDEDDFLIDFGFIGEFTDMDNQSASMRIVCVTGVKAERTA